MAHRARPNRTLIVSLAMDSALTMASALTIVVALTLASANLAAAQGQEKVDGKNKEGRRMRPAVEACMEASEGTTCSFPRKGAGKSAGNGAGEVSGTCTQRAKALVCVPEQKKNQSKARERAPRVVACNELAADDACSYLSRDGRTREGTCMKRLGTLQCQPKNAIVPKRGGKTE